MHLPPPISVTVGRSEWHKNVLLLLWLIGGAASFAFVMQQTSGWQRWVVPLSCVAAGWLAWQGWNHAVTGRLQWDGQDWYWTHFDRAPVGKLKIVLDFQSFVLVWLVSTKGHSTWLWLCATQEVTSWRALRRALVHSDKGLSAR